jgi:hypothetical protein
VDPAEAEQRIREICLGLPEAVEEPFGGHSAPSYRVRGKLFVMTSEDGGYITLKAGPGVQEALVTSDPGRFFGIGTSALNSAASTGGPALAH